MTQLDYYEINKHGHLQVSWPTERERERDRERDRKTERVRAFIYNTHDPLPMVAHVETTHCSDLHPNIPQVSYEQSLHEEYQHTNDHLSNVQPLSDQEQDIMEKYQLLNKKYKG